MKTFKKIILATILLFLIPIATPAQSKMEMSGAEKLITAYTEGIKTGNLDALMKLYTDDATIRNADQSMVSGKDNIKTQYKALLDNAEYNVNIAVVDETDLGKDYMYESGTYELTQINENIVTNGEFVNVLKMEKDGWKIYKSYRYPVNPNNVSTIDGLYKAFTAGDIPSVLSGMDANVVWNEAEGNSYADGNPYIGPDAVLKGVFARIGAENEYFKLKDIVLHEMSNNQVLATLRYDGKYKKNGATYDAQAAHLWTLKDGKVVAFQQYVDTKQLAEAEKK